MNEYDQIRLIASSLFPGEQRGGEVCPYCAGGRTRESTLSLTKTVSGVILYICHRAQCKRTGRIAGAIGTHHNGEEPGERKPPEFTPRLYTGSLDEVPDVISEYYIAKYGFTERQWRGACRWSREYQRTVWEVRSPSGALRGYELRSHRDEDRPKTLHNRHSAEEWTGFVPSGNSSPRSGHALVLVEDLISAYKVSLAGYRAASLMGSHISVDQLIEISYVSDSLPVVLSLDRDATQTALKLAKRYLFLCPDLLVVPLQRDLKYETPDQIKDILQGRV